MRVFVYYNLHRHLWSVKALEGPDKGRVIGWHPVVVLRGVEGKVSEAGRQRVIRTRKKSVHAGLVGEWITDGSAMIRGTARKVTYNPYLYETFVYEDDKTPFQGADVAVLANKTVYAA
ncbi:hypothetical protein SEA_SHAM4_88 [Mycobacterium phage Sham4]|uniref:hypothetical protein n=1 Tax=Mycobacterium phage Mulciber TaxID=1805459 RepID=UPI00078D536F|nr:hypothetical protein BJD74_gp18 [Mycobacterium phage Mulciber]AQT28261.1 hypothetical protein SEA_JABITH_91 [Mycobacterium phage Jabith]ASR86729.1 hypothetical protein SEA_ET2BRUTUS_91 [Mycobacterium phage Et2Brutus]AXC33448.1 hypothetical protein SEA_EBONY_90 [Mycobacterium phage Ebony]AXC33547.1 hypothetical protein SEA_JOSELITO_89 [Mycobacterium phage Joselito]AXH50770.1 hypothetical protein SEA_SNAPE_91 [Mycobacterium phage Snape]QBI97915.1 hypothetical protein SEA_ORANGE_91 [Mycobacte